MVQQRIIDVLTCTTAVVECPLVGGTKGNFVRCDGSDHCAKMFEAPMAESGLMSKGPLL
jgi:hypothetical protein